VADRYRLEGRNGYEPAPDVAALRFDSEEQAHEAAAVLLHGSQLADNPWGAQYWLGPVPVDDERQQAHLTEMRRLYGAG